MSEERDGALWAEVEEAVELLHEERFHEALAELHRVLKEDPKNYYAYHYLGVAMYEVGELQGSRDALRACTTLAPRYLGASVAYANVLRELEQPDEALKEAKRALEMAPDDADVLHAMGMACIAVGDRIQGRRYLNAFLAKKPEFEVGVEVQGILSSLDAEAANRPN